MGSKTSGVIPPKRPIASSLFFAGFTGLLIGEKGLIVFQNGAGG
jgi:hypothetical protein